MESVLPWLTIANRDVAGLPQAVSYASKHPATRKAQRHLSASQSTRSIDHENEPDYKKF
jgi:hypothetical protein